MGSSYIQAEMRYTIVLASFGLTAPNWLHDAPAPPSRMLQDNIP
jgi:hypothetical protein